MVKTPEKAWKEHSANLLRDWSYGSANAKFIYILKPKVNLTEKKTGKIYITQTPTFAQHSLYESYFSLFFMFGAIAHTCVWYSYT